MRKIILFNIEKNKLENVNRDNVLDELYLLKYRIPNKNEMDKDKIEIIRNEISKIDDKIPLYDAYSDNIYLIVKDNVYNRVVYNHYRFPDIEFYNNLIERKKNFNKTDDILENRKQRKINLMVDFLSYFNLEILSTTYVKVFYYYANEVGKNITLCKRPSFLPHFMHIKPYYSRSELINLALNMEIIKPDDIYYDKEKLLELCDKITKNDISADTILKHQVYMAQSGKVGIIQYYSLQGSFFMNQYLRNQTQYDSTNEYLEKLITIMWETINNAPEFDKSYNVYRFIEDDSYLSHLKINDVFIDPGFISTTRDPFYDSDNYKFGFILIKIKLPSKIKGVALCMETISHFPEEEEIILSPLSKLKLLRKDDNCIYYHTDNNFATKIKTKYEFEYIGKESIQFPKRSIPKSINLIDFLEINKPKMLTMQERIKYFTKMYAGELYQYKSLIGNNEYTIFMEWYDSIGAYKNFYASSTQNGFSMYNIDDNNMSFIMEIGETETGVYMYVNYYFRYTATPRNTDIDDNDFIKFISSIAYYFDIPLILIYVNYSTCDIISEITEDDNKKYFGGNYCVDFYNYLKNKRKRYNKIDSTIIKPNFGYYQLDRLMKTDPMEILDKTDRDELYQIYKKTYKPFIDNKDDNIGMFYLWIVDNHCYLSQILANKMFRLYNKNNPFIKDYYVLDPIGYLYTLGFILSYKFIDKSGSNDGIVLPKNSYRCDGYYKPRLPQSRKLKS